MMPVYPKATGSGSLALPDMLERGGEPQTTPYLVGMWLNHPMGVLPSFVGSEGEAEICPFPCGVCRVRSSSMLADGQAPHGP